MANNIAANFCDKGKPYSAREVAKEMEKRARHTDAVVAQPATDAAQKARRQSGDFGTFVIDDLNEPPPAERQIGLAKQTELSRDDFEELTGIVPEKNPATGKFEIGLYVIDDNGMRPKWSREDVLEWEVAERRLIENQELRFPCTPRQLVEFMDRGGFDGSFHNVLPDAFREAATLVPPDTSDAVDVPLDTLPADVQETWKGLWWAKIATVEMANNINKLDIKTLNSIYRQPWALTGGITTLGLCLDTVYFTDLGALDAPLFTPGGSTIPGPFAGDHFPCGTICMIEGRI